VGSYAPLKKGLQSAAKTKQKITDFPDVKNHGLNKFIQPNKSSKQNNSSTMNSRQEPAGNDQPVMSRLGGRRWLSSLILNAI